MTDNPNKTHRIHVRMAEKEYRQLQLKWRRTTFRKLSEYVRAKLLDKAIVTTYRNRSLDDFMREMVLLRKELNSIGNNFNQAIHKLHMSDTDEELKIWHAVFRKDRQTMLRHTEKIKEKINSIADIWLQ
nr:plasmid mobilization relaxosome protein MobC [Olivibacter jilunii]